METYIRPSNFNKLEKGTLLKSCQIHQIECSSSDLFKHKYNILSTHMKHLSIPAQEGINISNQYMTASHLQAESTGS